jgi:tetratricopeptide (TPR) repeat protein
VTPRPFEVTRLEELDRYPGEFETIPIRHVLGIGSFGVNAYSSPSAHGRVIEEHDELGEGAGGHEELYVVLSGRARFTLDGEERDAPAGTLVFVRDPAVRRGAVSEEPGTTVLVVGGVPGMAFTPSPWESWLAALPFYTRKEYGRAVEVMRAALGEHAGNANVLYNLACVEALAGETDAALAHLAEAAERDPRSRVWAQSDSDLDAIRDDPAFPAPPG